MSAPTLTPPDARVPRAWGRVLPPGILGHRPLRVIERNALAYLRTWIVFLTGFAEPVLYLLSVGIGVGRLVGRIPGPGGRPVGYRDFVAPGLLAASAMNGAILDTTFNFFVKFKYAHTYDAMLATPMDVGDVARGEVGWALLRGTAYASAFVVTMLCLGLLHSPWALLAVPAAALIAFAFAGAGIAATTCMRSFIDFDYVNLAIIPMFLFSGTFFPLSRYPDALAWLIRVLPLYQGVAIERALVLGHPDGWLVLQSAYLLALGAIGIRIATRRLGRLLQP
jgi:lipooligosaccharide transport system permease protein